MNRAVAVKQRGRQEEDTIRRIRIQKPEAPAAPPRRKVEEKILSPKLSLLYYGMLIFSFVFSGITILLFFLSIF